MTLKNALALCAAFAICSVAAAQQPQQAPQIQLPQITPAPASGPQNLAPAQTPQIMPMGGFPQAAQQPDPQQVAAQKAAEEAAKLKAKKEYFSKLFPEIDGVTQKIGAGFWEKNWIWFVCGAAALALAAFFIFRPRRVRKPTPFEIAIMRLNSAEDVFAKSGEKIYAQEVSQAVRDYIEAARGIPAPERTTEEFLELASQARIFDDAQRALLAKILVLADKAKFARHSFQEDERREILKASTDFVEADNRDLKEAAEKAAALEASQKAENEEAKK